MARFKRVACPRCMGHGLINSWEPTECPDCDMSGHMFISEGDRLFDYPGGPVRGVWPGRFAEAEAAGIEDYEWRPDVGTPPDDVSDRR